MKSETSLEKCQQCECHFNPHHSSILCPHPSTTPLKGAYSVPAVMLEQDNA